MRAKFDDTIAQENAKFDDTIPEREDEIPGTRMHEILGTRSRFRKIGSCPRISVPEFRVPELQERGKMI
jgi:hypothetical protein